MQEQYKFEIKEEVIVLINNGERGMIVDIRPHRPDYPYVVYVYSESALYDATENGLDSIFGLEEKPPKKRNFQSIVN